MARSRMIKPEFFHDEKLATLSIEARMFFIGMWVAADDYGVVKGHPQWLRAQIFPYDDAITRESVASILERLDKLNLIARYEANGEQFVYILNFTKHQRVDKPSKTRNPAPPVELLNTRESVASVSGVSRDEIEREREVKEKEKEVEPAQQVAPSADDLDNSFLSFEKEKSVGGLDEFSKTLGSLLTDGIEARAEVKHQQAKQNKNKPASVDAVVVELTAMVEAKNLGWSAQLISLRAEQWYEGYAGKFPNEAWRVSNKPIKDWVATLRNKLTYWIIDDQKHSKQHDTHQKPNKRAAIQSGAVKKFD